MYPISEFVNSIFRFRTSAWPGPCSAEQKAFGILTKLNSEAGCEAWEPISEQA